MKQLLSLALTALILAGSARLCQAADKREERPRFKGVELYSWKDKGGDWLFVLLDGTNRIKSENEVKGSKSRINGVEGLKKALSRLAVGERVFWTQPAQGFQLPPPEVRKGIDKAARKAKIDLHIAER